MAHDRVPGDEIRLTQEFLSEMIGVRRPGVTVIALALQEAGLIRYRRGKITVLDRGRLQARSCECYRVVEDEWDRVVGYGVRRRRR
jgi:Mn-dependent DtxR family transcriptional regulator